MQFTKPDKYAIVFQSATGQLSCAYHVPSVPCDWYLQGFLMISEDCFEQKVYHSPLFSFRNILYRLDERTSQFSVLLEALEHCKLHQSNETIQATLSEVLNSISSAQVYFKAGLDVFETTLAGKKWENSLHSKTICLQLTKQKFDLDQNFSEDKTFLNFSFRWHLNVMQCVFL